MHLLIVEDSPNVSRHWRGLLTRTFPVATVQSAANMTRALASLGKRQPDLLLLDLVIPRDGKDNRPTWENGREVLRHVRDTWPWMKIIVLSSRGELTRDFLREEDADDFFTKDALDPGTQDRLLARIEELAGHLVCDSPAMQAAVEQVDHALASGPVAVVEGPPGSGKDYVAELIHTRSPRARLTFHRAPLGAARSASFLGDMVGSRGTYEFCGVLEDAGCGTVYLDHLEHIAGDVLLQSQLAALLGEMRRGRLSFTPLGGTERLVSDCRIVVSMTGDLRSLRDQEALSADLYRVLSRQPRIVLPSLDERLGDVPRLCEVFRRQFNREHRRSLLRFERPALDTLQEQAGLSRLGSAADLRDLVWEALEETEGESVPSEHLQAALDSLFPASERSDRASTDGASERHAPTSADEVSDVASKSYEAVSDSFARAETDSDRVDHLDRLTTLGQLLSGAVHEAQNPLTAVIGMAQLIGEKQDQLAPDEVREFAQIIAGEARRVSAMLREIKDYGSKREFVPEALTLESVADEAVALVVFDHRFRKIRIEREYREPAPTQGDRNRLKQVFINLLTNAADALEEGRGVIEIRIGAEGDTVVARVTDNGAGISADKLPKIWEPFFSTKGAAGTGIGLDITRKIVEMHGGRITAESEVGKGTTFCVTLPMCCEVTAERGP